MTQAWAKFNGPRAGPASGYGVLADHYAIWLPAAQAGDLGHALAAAGAKPIGAAALEAFRIAEGIPVYGVDMVERDLPQETAQTRALHFNKGCYLGQEIVERIRSRGQRASSPALAGSSGPLPEPGTALTLDGAEAGHITSATELPLHGVAPIGHRHDPRRGGSAQSAVKLFNRRDQRDGQYPDRPPALTPDVER